jgi:type IV pilus assembly protein PilE
MREKTSTASRRASDGFSLTELLIAMVIVTVITAIALPAYQSQAMAAKRATGRAALQDAASRQEQFLLDNKSYTGVIAAGGLNLTALTEGGHYLLSVDAATAACPITRCYLLRAVPQGAQAADSCGPLTLSSDGDRQPAACW